MKALITGAAGFLGRECVKHFHDAGYEVIGTDLYGNVDIVGDLSDRDFVFKLPSVDVVVNCAAVQYVTKNLPLIKRYEFFDKNNVLSAANLSERYKDESCHFVHIGTSMMYQQSGLDKYSIISPMLGEGVYSESKLRAQKHINTIRNSATIIPCIIGGEGREGLFTGFVKSLKNFGVVAFPGRGDHKINMVHVYDVASLILQVATVRAAGLFNAAAPDPLSIKEWINEISDELGVDNVHVLPIPLLPVKLFAWLTQYRILAREQMLMLEVPHVLSIKESLATGWTPKYNNSQISRDIAKYISEKNN